MMRRGLPMMVALVLTALLQTGCASSGDAGSGRSVSPKYVALWTLVSIEGVDASPIVGDATLPSLEISDDGQVTGFTGVNRFSSRLDPGAVRRNEPLFGPIMSTKMGGPEHLMALESLLVSALSDARKAPIRAGRLVLEGADGRELARFSSTPR